MKKGKKVMTTTIIIVCFLLVMIIFMQFKVVQQREEINVDVMQEAELRQELLNWKNKYDETKEKYNETIETLESYKQESSTDGDKKELLETELETQEQALGKTEVEGEGIIITLTEKTEDELDKDEDEEITYIYTDDLVYIINSLKDSGAEAISINGKRIVNTTDIANVGKTVKINGEYLRTHTYEIKAIGNSAYLESAIAGKGGYAEQLDISGIKTNIEKSNKVRIPKYDGDFDFKYMEEAK